MQTHVLLTLLYIKLSFIENHHFRCDFSLVSYKLEASGKLSFHVLDILTSHNHLLRSTKVFGSMFSFETKSGEFIVLQSCDFADEIRQLN